jgi:hypothetical protein
VKGLLGGHSGLNINEDRGEGWGCSAPTAVRVWPGWWRGQCKGLPGTASWLPCVLSVEPHAMHLLCATFRASPAILTAPGYANLHKPYPPYHPQAMRCAWRQQWWKPAWRLCPPPGWSACRAATNATPSLGSAPRCWWCVHATVSAAAASHGWHVGRLTAGCRQEEYCLLSFVAGRSLRVCRLPAFQPGSATITRACSWHAAGTTVAVGRGAGCHPPPL